MSHADSVRGFTVKYPASWKNTSLSRLGDGETDAYGVVGFADQSGPEEDGQFLNFVEVDVFADVLVDESMLPDFEEAMRLSLEDAGDTYEDVEVIEPIQSVSIGGSPGLALTVRFSWRGRAVIVSDYVVIANQRAYGLEVSAVEEDFEECTPLFEKIIQDFQVGPSSLLI